MNGCMNTDPQKNNSCLHRTQGSSVLVRHYCYHTVCYLQIFPLLSSFPPSPYPTSTPRELCGDLSTYADKWRPDAEGCEAAADNKSVGSLQLGPSGGAAPVNFQIGGNARVHAVGGPDQSSVTGTMTSSVTNQIAASVPPHVMLARSVSAQNMTIQQVPRTLPLPSPQPHHQPHPLALYNGTSTGPPTSPPSSPLACSSPPPSPGVPLSSSRRHSTQSLQEYLFRPQLERPAASSSAIPPTTPSSLSSASNPPPISTATHPAAPSEALHALPHTPATTNSALPPLPRCGLPTSPPPVAPAATKPSGARPSDCSGSVSSRFGGGTATHSSVGSRPPRHSVSELAHPPSTQGGHFPRRHARSKSSGPITVLPPSSPLAHPQSSASDVPQQRTHSRNLSTSNISQGGRGREFADAPKLLRSSVSLSPKFPPSAATPPSPPDPERGYDFAKHFNLFSPFTSNMALEYCHRESDQGSQVTETPPPAVWSMDVWKNYIAVGCGNGQIEVGVA